MVSPLLRGLVGLMALCGLPGLASAGLPAGVNHQITWVPDYFGRKVVRSDIDQTTNPSTFKTKTIDVGSRNCNPNSVAIQGNSLYVVCNSDFGGADKVLIYDATTYVYRRTITGLAPDGHAYFSGAGLLGIVFDSHKNLWVSGYSANSLFRIPFSQLGQTNPRVDRQVIQSPDQPAGMTLGPDGSFWIVGQFSGGILLQFPDATLNAAGTFDYNNPLNPAPSACLSKSIAGCNPVAGLFNEPEGVAWFNNAVWVSNNGGGSPGKTLVRAIPQAGGGFTTSIYGGTEGAPFSCPGGLFTATKPGVSTRLWVNDEGHGMPGTDCGASAAFQASQVGLVMSFTATDLLSHKASPTPENFTGSARIKTGSPGFGGLFVQVN